MVWEEAFPNIWIAQIGQFRLTVRHDMGFWNVDLLSNDFSILSQAQVPGDPDLFDAETAKHNALMLCTAALGNAVGATTEAYLELAKVVMEKVESSVKGRDSEA